MDVQMPVMDARRVTQLRTSSLGQTDSFMRRNLPDVTKSVQQATSWKE
jgi:hypothetical protein